MVRRLVKAPSPRGSNFARLVDGEEARLLLMLMLMLFGLLPRARARSREEEEETNLAAVRVVLVLRRSAGCPETSA